MEDRSRMLAANPCRGWANVFHKEIPKQNPFIKMPSSTASPIKAQKAFPVSLQPCELCKKASFSHQNTKEGRRRRTELRPWSLDVGGWNNNLLFWEYYNIWLRTQSKVYLFHLIAFSHYVIGLICRTWNWELGSWEDLVLVVEKW